MKQRILKAITTMMFGIILLSFVSAFDYNLTAGETFTQDLGFEIMNCSITNNHSNLDGLNLSWQDTNLTISTVINYKPDNFTIDCWVMKYGEVEELRNYGGDCTYKKDFDWNCSEWGDCINGIQTRICKEYNNCHTTYGKPVEAQNCLVKIETDEHGCILTEGYVWCELKQKCLNPIEEECVDDEVEEDEESSKLYLYFILSFVALIAMALVVLVIHKKMYLKESKTKPIKNKK